MTDLDAAVSRILAEVGPIPAHGGRRDGVWDPTLDEAAALTAHRSAANRNGARAAADLFRRWRPTELLESDLTLRWSVRGVLADPTYGQIAGEMKTLKSYLATFLALSVATGTPLFDRWPIDRPGPVLAYVGEGGRIPFTRRLVRVAQAMGIDLNQADLMASFDVAPVGSPRFDESLERDLAEIAPVLFVLDPLYAFHGTRTNAANLHEEGALLSGLSGPCTDAGTSLLIVNHFNQTGSGGGLKRITQSGSGEWCDSWILTSHREAPEVAAGAFKLLLEIGSRQWGGTTWDLDLNIGVLDPDTGTHDGPIGWDLRRHEPTGESSSARHDKRAEAILDILSDHPWEKTRTEITKLVGGRGEAARVTFDQLESDGRIRRRTLPRAEGTRSVNRPVWGRSDQLAPDETFNPVPTPATVAPANGERP